VAQILVASHALGPVDEDPFHDLFDDMSIFARERAQDELMARWQEFLGSDDSAQCREFLIGLVEEAIESLNANLEVYEENADEYAERTVARLSVDTTPEGRRIDEHLLKCMRAFERGVDTFRKHQKKVKSERSALRVDDLRPIPEYRRPRLEDRGPRADEIRAWAVARAGWFGREASQPNEPNQSKGSPPLAEGPAELERENRTNEANVDENVIIIQNEEPVEFTPNSGVDSRLDKREKQRCGAENASSADMVGSSSEPAEIPPPHDSGGGDNDLIPPCGWDLATVTRPPPSNGTPNE
jgi:hypothetical protein